MISVTVLVAVAVGGMLDYIWKRSLQLATVQQVMPATLEQPRMAPPSLPPSAPAREVVVSQTTTMMHVTPVQAPVAQACVMPTAVVLSVRQVGLPLLPITAADRGEKVSHLPFTVYADCAGEFPYTASGYMGNYGEMEFDDCCRTTPHEGDSCICIAYKARHQWVGVAWQEPPNNWGDIPGGYDLSGARKLTFWARGHTGMEQAEFKMGLIGRTKKYADSARVTTGKVRLTKDWRKYEISLAGLDLCRIITAFVVVLQGAPTPTIVYLDEIRFE